MLKVFASNFGQSFLFGHEFVSTFFPFFRLLAFCCWIMTFLKYILDNNFLFSTDANFLSISKIIIYERSDIIFLDKVY